MLRPSDGLGRDDGLLGLDVSGEVTSAEMGFPGW